jgi:hemerythrin-like domain-containing protein
MATPDASASEFFSDDHRHCDDAWAAVEQAAGSGDAALATTKWTEFAGRMRRHLAMEEEVLFPAIEDVTQMRGAGPTEVMRHEHRQMRGLLDEMARRADSKDFDGLLDQGDTLLMLIAQHNAKEEGVLYPMADSALAARWPELAQTLRSRF